MLIVPVAEKFTWKNPPYVTILIIILNIIIFARYQGSDNTKWEKAINYYFESGLGDIEIPLYEKYRDSVKKPLTVPEKINSTKESKGFYIFRQMEQDSKFQKLLQSDAVITPAQPEYDTWKELRGQFQKRKDSIFSEKYQFVPADHKSLTFVSYMFLHGSFGHLFGNMLFLWLFGSILEIGCGRSRYLLLYGITGTAAVALFWVCRFDSITGLVGASGAISGLMGAYTVLFGKSRIKLFMYLGFYFNYVRLPAIALLPFWLSRELYALFFGPPNNVAYTAHIGGIVSGVIFGIILLRYSKFNKDEVLKEKETDASIPLIEEALSCIGQLEFTKGKELLEKAIEANGLNYTAYDHLYNIEKQTPASDGYHSIVRRYLTVLSVDEEMHKKVFNIYREYKTLAKPRLTPDLYMTLCIIFSRNGKVDEAEKILTMILKKMPDLPKMPTALLKLAEAFKNSMADEKSKKYLNFLIKRFPETPEAAIALKKIKDTN